MSELEHILGNDVPTTEVLDEFVELEAPKDDGKHGYYVGTPTSEFYYLWHDAKMRLGTCGDIDKKIQEALNEDILHEDADPDKVDEFIRRVDEEIAARVAAKEGGYFATEEAARVAITKYYDSHEVSRELMPCEPLVLS